MTATPDTPSANKFSILSKAIPPMATTGRLVFKIISFNLFSHIGFDASFLELVL